MLETRGADRRVPLVTAPVPQVQMAAPQRRNGLFVELVLHSIHATTFPKRAPPLVLVIVGTLTYTTSQDWSLVHGFYFAVATLTTSSIADPDLTITSAPIKIFTVFYILVGIGILVELARQLGFAYIEVRRAERAAKAAKADQAAET